jgi:hypothetical protein
VGRSPCRVHSPAFFITLFFRQICGTALRTGKRDLYAAFTLRCLELAADRGRVAMVTQQSWMFLRSFADLRATEDQDSSFQGLLRETTIEALAHLGPGALGELSGEVSGRGLFPMRWPCAWVWTSLQHWSAPSPPNVVMHRPLACLRMTGFRQFFDYALEQVIPFGWLRASP